MIALDSKSAPQTIQETVQIGKSQDCLNIHVHVCQNKRMLLNEGLFKGQIRNMSSRKGLYEYLAMQ